MTVQANFSVYRGEDASLVFAIYEADGVTPQNITGWSLSFTVRPAGGIALIAKTVGNGIALTTPASGIATVTLAAADTSSLPAVYYSFSLARTDSGQDAELTSGLMILLSP